MAERLEFYQKAKEAAYRILLNSRISALPFDIVHLSIVNDLTILKNSEAKQLRNGESAIIIYDGN